MMISELICVHLALTTFWRRLAAIDTLCVKDEGAG
jgi:hypothetical protein